MMILVPPKAISLVAVLGVSSFCQGFVRAPTITLRGKLKPRYDNNPTHGDADSRTPSSTSYLPLALSSASSPQKNGRPSTKNKDRNGSGDGKRWDRRQRRNHHQRTTEQVARLPPQPRPTVTNYNLERNDDVNEQRLFRDNISCEHFESCPGCAVQQYIGQVDIVRSAKRFFSSTAIRKNRMDVVQSGQDWVVEEEDDGFYQLVVPSTVTNWRTQAKLVAAPKSSSWAKDGCKFGLYQKGTHEVLDIPRCQVHHPSINRAIEALEKATDKVGTAAYTADSRDSVNGGLRYVQLQVERTTGKVSLTLVWASPELKYTQPGLSRLTKELQSLEPDLWHSVWCHCNDGSGNNIFSRNSRNWHRLSGPEFVREPLPVGNFGWLYFSPLAFRQGNMDGFDIIANDVARAVPGGTRVCELYAGVGLLGLTSLVYHDDKGTPLVWVRCSDENPANTRCFSRSLQSM
jgi:tRNA/tmRNA/rRNA uracil-C5-methylase (TrmA/RlmC/RlmD family)